MTRCSVAIILLQTSIADDLRQVLQPIKVSPPWLTSLPHHLTPHIPSVNQTPSGAPNAAATTP